MRLYVIVLVLGSGLLALACNKGSDPSPVTSFLLIRGVGIYFRDSASNNMLIGRTGQRYHADSIKIYKVVNGNNQLIGSVNADSLGQSVCNFIYVYNQVNTEDAIKPLTIDLPVYIYFNQFDTDTISIKKQANTDISVYWNTQLVQTVPASDTRVPYLLVIKKK